MSLTSSLVKRIKALFKRGQRSGDSEVETELRDVVATQSSADAAELSRRLSAGDITLKQFQTELYLMTRHATIAQYALGRGGMEALTADDLATLGQLMTDQARYLRDFVTAIGAGELTPEQIAARAALYPESAIGAHSRGVAAAHGLELPVYPPAHVLCRCWIEYGGEGETTTFSWMTAEDERVCPICSGLAAQYNNATIEVPA